MAQRKRPAEIILLGRPCNGLVYGLATRCDRETGVLAGGQTMICPTCHGNGYWVDKLRVMRQVRQCKTCSSQGEIKELKNAKTNET
jgi:DnaJ-class molecular chaperone